MSEIDTRPRLYVKEAILKGFKSIDDLHIKLNPGLNIIIGPNGSGKSNLIEFLNNALYSIYKTSDLTFKSAQLILKSTNGDEINYKIDRIPPNKSQPFGNDDLFSEPFHQYLLVNDILAYDDWNEEGVSHFKYHDKRLRSSRTIRLIFGKINQRFVLPSYIRYTLPGNLFGVEEPLSMSIPLTDDDFFFDYDTNSNVIHDILGELQNALLGDLIEAEESIDSSITETAFSTILKSIDSTYCISKLKINEGVISNLSQFTPIKNIRVNENINIYQDDKNFIIDNIKLDFFVNDNWLPWSQLSDGTKRLFFIISEISLKSDGMILVEEPELGVHPHQFNLIMQFLEEQSATKQIIMSTHSPGALDILDKNNLHRIFITKYEKGKGTTISNLNQQQKEKAAMYMEEVGFLSDYWLLSDLEA